MEKTQQEIAKEEALKIFRDVWNIHSEEALAPILKSCRLETFEKDEILFREGQLMTDCTFLVSGSFYVYIKDDNDRDIVVCISDEYGEPAVPFSNPADFHKPMFVYIAALEDMTALFVPTDVLLQVVSTSTEAVSSFTAAVGKWNDIHSKMAIFNTYPIEERYYAYRAMYPKLFSRLSQSSAARILNVSCAALSRALNE